MAWIKNEGKQPVADDVLVRVKFGVDDEPIDENDINPAGELYWGLESVASITEYEIVEPQRQAQLSE